MTSSSCDARTMRIAALLVNVMALSVSLLAAPASLGDEPSAVQKPTESVELKRFIQPLVDKHAGKVAVVIRHLDTGELFAHQANEPMPTASLIKFPVMIEVYRQADSGKVNLDQPLNLREEDKVPGSGILTPHFSAGTRVSLRDAVRLMIAYSDNTATNLVLDQVGLDSVGETMASLNAPNTKIYAKVFRRDTSIAPDKSRQYGLGSTTAAEMVQLLVALHKRELVSDAACQQMLAHLASCQDNTKLLRDLPVGTKMAHKTGSVSQARCDAGILNTPTGPVAICVLTAQNEDRRFTNDNAAVRLMGEIGRVTFRHFSKGAETADSSPVTLKSGDHGKLVEYLQKTLNARTKGNAEVDVDGDFGPQTADAVQTFQEQHDLVVSGVVDAATWKALGPLVTADAPVAPPAEINAIKLKRDPMDPLSGQPFVSCRAWYALDGSTGKQLTDFNGDKPLDFASTTKVMTAYLVLRAAKDDDSILDEIVTFSNRADQTVGSTSGIMVGERLPVRELLYGLLLPSGNDASVALAEHFGARFAERFKAKPLTEADHDSVTLFVAAMNAAANSLEMKSTKFENPHGLTAVGHKSTAADLAKLAWHAYQLPHFADYVGTRQRGCTVHSASGYERNVVWKNTNRLLRTEGYLGIKTGTTSAAGACLISLAERDGRKILLVTLGSASSTARYTDSRNLFRWLWEVDTSTKRQRVDPNER